VIAQEPSYKAQLELFTTNINVFEIRWQHVLSLGCQDVETAWHACGMYVSAERRAGSTVC